MKNRSKSRKSDLRKQVALTLPGSYPWKVLHWLTEDLEEYLEVDELTELRRITRNRDFSSYLRLSEAWGLQSISPTDTSISAMRAKYLLASLLKKFRFQTDKKERESKAYAGFRKAEDKCSSFNLSGFKELVDSESEFSRNILFSARQFLARLLGDHLPGHRALLDRARHGPGATIGTKKGNISQYHKFCEWPYSCTIDAVRYARFSIETDQRWFGALQDSYRSRFGIPKQMPIDMELFWQRVIKVVDGNRITTVPKDAQKERTIAIEPVLNLYLQLGVDGFIRRRLKRFGVNLDSQEKNQELARLGSRQLGQDGFVTVDLSAASDSISLKLCELLLPSEWYSYLVDLRSPSGILDGENLVYQKISSMGNGYTFALESAIFTAIIYAVMIYDGAGFNRSDFAVFGDDLIIRKRHYYKLVEALRLSGFGINLEKTFTEGYVRESCGTDWFRGTPLRPVFFTELPSNVMELFTDINRLSRLLSLRFGLEESKTSFQMKKWIPDKAQRYVGPRSDEEFDSYLHVPYPPKGLWENSMYKYPRLIVIPRSKKGPEFFFRKLMHNLRGREPIPFYAMKHRRRYQFLGAGSRFRVTSRNALILSSTSSVANHWRSEYEEFYPRRYTGDV